MNSTTTNKKKFGKNWNKLTSKPPDYYGNGSGNSRSRSNRHASNLPRGGHLKLGASGASTSTVRRVPLPVNTPSLKGSSTTTELNQLGTLGTVWRGSSGRDPARNPEPERATWNQQQSYQKKESLEEQEEIPSPTVEAAEHAPEVTLQDSISHTDTNDDLGSTSDISSVEVDLSGIDLQYDRSTSLQYVDDEKTSPPLVEKSSAVTITDTKSSSAIPVTQAPILWTEYEHRTVDVSSRESPAPQRARMLYDPKSGSMIPHSQNSTSRPESKGLSKSKQRRLRQQQQTLTSSPSNSSTRVSHVNAHSSTNNIQVLHRSDQHPTQSQLRSQQSTPNQQHAAPPKRTLPRTCGVLYSYIDPKTLGIADTKEAVYAMRGYGSYSVPGGIFHVSSELVKDQVELELQQDHHEGGIGSVNTTISADQYLRSNAPSWQPTGAFATQSQLNSSDLVATVLSQPSHSSSQSNSTNKSITYDPNDNIEDDNHLLELGLGFDPTSATQDIIMSPPMSSAGVASNSIVPSIDLDASLPNSASSIADNIGVGHHFAILGSPSRRRNVDWNFRSLTEGAGVLADDTQAW